MISNWQQGKAQSNYHFDWQRSDMPGHDYRWITRFIGDWTEPLNKIISQAEPKTWASRGKKYHPDHPDLQSEQNDLKNAGIDTEQIIFRKAFDFSGVFKTMIESLHMQKTKQAFHIQHPGEMLNLHIDKQYEMHNDHTRIARFFIFLEDWKPGHFMHMGTSFVKWRKGDVLWFDWANMPHASANAGWEPRCLIQVTGTITKLTEKLLLGNTKEIKL
jgi:hypothetical protein